MNLIDVIKFKSVQKKEQDELDRRYQVQVGSKKGAR